MSNLETVLASLIIKSKITDNISDAEIIIESGKPWLVYKYKNKPYKTDLSIIQWAPLETMYYTLCFTEMLSAGYLLIPMDNGWECISPKGNNYEVTENSCTCGAFVWSKNKGAGKTECKHIKMLKGSLSIRQRVIQAKNSI